MNRLLYVTKPLFARLVVQPLDSGSNTPYDGYVTLFVRLVIMRLTFKSWELWHSLYTHPAVNAPLFKNYSKISPQPVRQGGFTSRFHLPNFSNDTKESIFLTLIFVGILIFLSNLTTIMQAIARVVITSGGLLGLCALILPGMNVALKVSAAVFQEQEKGRYDLLALTPRGLAAIYWALVMRCLRDDLLAVRLRQLVSNLGNLFVIPMIAGLIPAMLIALVIVAFDFSFALQILATVGLPIVVLAVFYADYMQSIVIAVLMSMVIPAYIYSRSGIWMAWVAPLLFVGGQVLFYLIYFVFLRHLGTYIVGASNTDFSLTICKQALIAFGVLVTFRELMIRQLWRLAVSQFSEDLRELRLD